MTFALFHMPAPLVHALGWTLLHSLWQALVVLALFRAALIFIRLSDLKTRYIIALIALLLIPLLSVITFIHIYPEQNQFSAFQAGDAGGSPVPHQLTVLLQSYAKDTFIGQISFKAFMNDMLNLLNGHLDLIASLWMIGMLIFMFRFAGGYLYSRRLRSRHVHEVGDEWKSRLETLRARMHIRRYVRLFESVKIRIPSVMGFLKPVILIPAGALTQIPPCQLEAVLVHELTHIYRKDYLVNMLQVFIETLFFYHPVVWWLSARIRSEREFICDEISLTYCQDTVTYMKALASLQELSSSPPVFAAALASGKSQLMIRIKRIVNPRSFKPENTGGFIMLLLTLALITVTASAALSLKENPGPDRTVSDQFKENHYQSPGHQGLLGSVHLFPGITSPEQKLVAMSRNRPAAPDTALKSDTLTPSQQKALQEYKEALKQQEMARQQMREAAKERQEAERQYREAFRQERDFEYQKYEEALKEAQHRLQELCLPDSLNFKIPHGSFSPRDFYFDPGPGVHYIPYDLKLPDIYYNYPELEDLPDFIKVLPPDSLDPERKIMIVPPDPHDRKERYFIHVDRNTDRTESILKSELLKDGIISGNGEYVVYIDSGMMSVNGEKQQREVFKKYKRLLETATGMEIRKGFTYFY